ncbi:TonB-dependent receptor [Flavitalea flava]
MVPVNLFFFRKYGYDKRATCLFIFLSLLLLLPAAMAIAQKGPGKLTGKVSDGSTNEPLAGVSISAKNTKTGVSTITDGTYILSLPAGTYTIDFSYSGHKKKEITGVIIKAGESSFLDILLEATTKQLESVVVTAGVKRETQSSVYSAQKRSAAVSDGISLEAIRKTPDNNAGQILKRVTGVNVQDNRFVVVRGLGEQYNQTMLNGVPMTSTETNRNAFAFDLIPAAVIDNITINKTATPDMPGNFAGGIVQINTKDFPASDFFSVLVQAGYSDQTYGKDFYSDKRGKYEWLSFDGGIRDLPKGFPTSTSRVPFTTLNAQEQFRYLRMLKNNFEPVNNGPSGLNENLQLGYGKTIKFKNETQLGIVAAFNQRKTELTEQEVTAREVDLTAKELPVDRLRGLGYYSENTRYRYSVDFGGVVNVAYRFGNNKISLKNLYTRVFNNTFIDRPDILADLQAFTGSPILVGINYFTESRTILNSTLAGEHRTGKTNETRLEWNVNATSNYTNTPDSRNYLLGTDSARKIYAVKSDNSGLSESLYGFSRIWTQNKDFIAGGAFNITTPFLLLKAKQLLKGGILFQNRERKATGTILPIGHGYGTLDSLFAPSAYSPSGVRVDLATTALSQGSGNYNAGSSLLAAYESLENKIGKKFRVIWGLRIEDYQQTVNLYIPAFYPDFQEPVLTSAKFASRTTFNFLPSVNMVYSPTPAINIRAAYSNTVIRPELKDLAEYQRYDLQTFALTSGNSNLKSTNIQNYDLKFEWFPSSGEIASIALFYKNLQDPIEYAFSTQDNNLNSRYAVNTGSAFVRGIEAEIRKKIDFIPFASWLSHLTLFGNGALLKSRVNGKFINSNVISSFSEHSLTGQPPYILNAGASLLLIHETFEATVSFNRTGDYINELGSSDLDVHLANGKLIPRRPHYWVKARDLMDLVISQSFLHNKAKFKFNVTNLLNQRYILYQDLNGNGKFDTPVRIKKIGDRTNNYLDGIDNTASSIRPQRTYSFSFSYTF